MTRRHSVLVLGAGRVGSAIARDLDGDDHFDVTVADRDTAALERVAARSGVATKAADLSDTDSLRALLGEFDLAVGAVPGWMGFQTLKTVIEAGLPVVDISFFEQDPFALNALARDRGVTAVVDCGVAPGLSNLVLGREERRFTKIDRFLCMVGGLPQSPTPPWNYKAPYSPCDVLEMYTRPARLRRNGEVLTMPALTENEPIDFPGVGAMEAFNTDGLRTLLETSAVPDLVEKTLRYPGTCDQIALLQDSGFFETTPRTIGEAQVSPRALSESLLFDQWHQGPEDWDLTAMRLVVEGTLAGRRQRVTYDLLDRHDRELGISSMARTTGYPCAAVVRLVASGAYAEPGVSPPEFLGRDTSVYDAVMKDIGTRGVRFDLVYESL